MPPAMAATTIIIGDISIDTKYTADIKQSGVHCMAISFIAVSIEILMSGTFCYNMCGMVDEWDEIVHGRIP